VRRMDRCLTAALGAGALGAALLLPSVGGQAGGVRPPADAELPGQPPEELGLYRELLEGTTIAGQFTDQSLEGVYVFEGEAEGGDALSRTHGVLRADGHGNFEGVRVLNTEGEAPGERLRLEVVSSGTYSVDPEGPGTGIGGVREGLAGGVIGEERSFSILITQSSQQDGHRLALRLVLLAQEADPVTGGLWRLEAVRVPEGSPG
jgi:hypothetical protein